MERMIFVNLPVADLAASRKFYEALGFPVNPEFSDEQVACLVVSDSIFVMLLERSRFADFLSGTQVADARSTTQVLNALSASEREEVDRLAEAALAHGGTDVTQMAEGPMYGRSVADPDGHVWEFIHMADH